MHASALRVVVAVVATVAIQALLIECAKPPNIIVILLDDVGYGDLGCYGSPSIRTPNLDRMASEGMRFTECYTAQPICTPARSALLTGRLPVRVGFYQNVSMQDDNNSSSCGVTHGMSSVLWWNSVNGIPQRELTFPEMLKSRNYTSFVVGKWHVGIGRNWEYLPMQNGWDRFFGIPLWHMGNENEAEIPDVPLLNGNTVLGRLFRDIPLGALIPMYTDEILGFMREHSQDSNPFMLYYAPDNTHAPVGSSPRFTNTSLRGPYGDALQETDWSIGMILDELRTLGIANDTMVFFSSDNGPALYMLVEGPHYANQLEAGSAGPLRGGKGTTWEGGVRVPGIAWWPGTIPAGEIVDEAVSLMDLFPTAASLAGVSLPPELTLDGVDITRLLTGQGSTGRDFLFHWRSDTLYAVTYQNKYKAHFVTQGQEMYTIPATQVHNPPLLFDIQRDPGERAPINGTAFDPQYNAVIAAVRQAAQQHVASFRPAAALFNDCDDAAGFWKPDLPVPPSNPTCCVGGGN